MMLPTQICVTLKDDLLSLLTNSYEVARMQCFPKVNSVSKLTVLKLRMFRGSKGLMSGEEDTLLILITTHLKVRQVANTLWTF
jgi:hypothetical protein